MECFPGDFFVIFNEKRQNFSFWVAGWLLVIKSKHLGDFLYFPNFLSQLRKLGK